jgi:hypothetical protein
VSPFEILSEIPDKTTCFSLPTNIGDGCAKGYGGLSVEFWQKMLPAPPESATPRL